MPRLDGQQQQQDRDIAIAMLRERRYTLQDISNAIGVPYFAMEKRVARYRKADPTIPNALPKRSNFSGGRPITPPAKTTRSCLCCGALFGSTFPARTNRICLNCKNSVK